MTLRAKLKCEEPDKIEYSITLTMSAKEWDTLRTQMQEKQPYSWPACEVIGKINDVLSQARKIYWASETVDPNSPF